MKKRNVQTVANVALMSALVYVSSLFLQINIPTAVDNTRLHMGNVMCLLSGLILGPVYGGLSAGIGSMFFDLTNPLYVTSAPFTFLSKFIMAWICAKIFKKSTKSFKISCVLSTTVAAFTYVILYIAKSFVEQYFILGFAMQTTLITTSQKAIVSLVNAIFAIIITSSLAIVLLPTIKKYSIK